MIYIKDILRWKLWAQLGSCWRANLSQFFQKIIRGLPVINVEISLISTGRSSLFFFERLEMVVWRAICAGIERYADIFTLVTAILISGDLVGRRTRCIIFSEVINLLWLKLKIWRLVFNRRRLYFIFVGLSFTNNLFSLIATSV